MVKFTEKDIAPALIALVGGMVGLVLIALPLFELMPLPLAIFAGIPEEPAKVIGLILIAWKFPQLLQSKTKGAVFGVLAGVGFATLENFYYYYIVGAPALLRTLLPAPMHMLCSAIVGMGLVYIATKGKEGRKNALELLVLAMILHGMYNAIPPIGLPIVAIVFYILYKKLPEYPVPLQQTGILRLPSRDIWLTRAEKIFRRNDFEQDVPLKKLDRISREHFKIMRRDDRFYIEDLGSKGGTKLNGVEIKGKGMQELMDGSEIALPADLKMSFTRGEIIEGITGIKTVPSVPSKIVSAPLAAKIILPNNQEIAIAGKERIFGRGDFKGCISDDERYYISKLHFSITKENDRFYIEDKNSKNGTKLNGVEIKDMGRKELKDGDEIAVANVLNMKFNIRR